VLKNVVDASAVALRRDKRRFVDGPNLRTPEGFQNAGSVGRAVGVLAIELV
jgi:hypothetical protein